MRLCQVKKIGHTSSEKWYQMYLGVGGDGSQSRAENLKGYNLSSIHYDTGSSCFTTIIQHAHCSFKSWGSLSEAPTWSFSSMTAILALPGAIIKRLCGSLNSEGKSCLPKEGSGSPSSREGNSCTELDKRNPSDRQSSFSKILAAKVHGESQEGF